MSWGTELWDQFDSLEKHTLWGIEFLERYTKFVKERCEIEVSYAKQIRNLSKKYQPKKTTREEEESKYTSCRAFLMTLNELNDYAGQHEVIAENLTAQIVSELTHYVQELKAERKLHFHDGRKAQQHIENSWKQLESSKRRFERDCKEADRAQQYFEKMDADINVTKADVEKARQQAQMRNQMAEHSKSEYSSSLQSFNQEQTQHYHTLIPHIFQRIQEMEECRIGRVADCMRAFAEVERRVLPILAKCLDGMTKAADSIQPKNDSKQVVESYKSGFEPPGDVEFEDYEQAMRRVASESSLPHSRGEKASSRNKGKLWPFIKRNRLMSLLTSPRQPPPPPPASPAPSAVPNGPHSPRQHRDPLSHRLNDLMGSKPRMHCFRSLKRGLSLKLGSGPEDFSHLPPEQRRKKLQARLEDIGRDIQKELDQKDALTKMRDVYTKNPQMGDSSSIDPRLAEICQNIERLRLEAQKFEGWLAEVEGRMQKTDTPRRQSGTYETQNNTPVNSTCTQDRESPDGSYTEDQSSETQLKAPNSELEDEFEDEEPLPTIGTCKSLYPFEGHSEGTMSVAEGEILHVIEEDKGDGWTRVRRNDEEEGYVPTSYIEIFLDTNGKDS
ncbi:formin-binding protein 1-like [Megalops cyprinoides]|uniref:formin-binding protein 1-like n=1 Tax=Megalops cyprinoides TaxID=118141 RepID=UPI001863A0F4|nr:formin-binding protein 1-like [Megalops cyprinoides]